MVRAHVGPLNNRLEIVGFFIMCYTYIIYSHKIDNYYMGVSSDDVAQRIENHNSGKYGGKSFTSNATD